MTILEKLSDRGSFIFEAIKMVIIHKGFTTIGRLQWDLFQCGVYVKAPLLNQALSVMEEKGLIKRTEKPKENEVVPEAAKASV
jgi:DNA-binding HxlR family transcriptional regulator